MKRFIICLLACLLPGMALAANCTSSQDGNWTSASTWGGSACTPTASDTVRIDHIVSGNFTGTVTVLDLAGTGTLNMVAGDRQISSATTGEWTWEGTFNAANGTVIAFTANSGSPGIFMPDPGHFISDATDIGALRTVTSFASSATSGACVSGDNWTVGISPVPTGLIAGDLVQFVNWDGAAFGRMYEIVVVSSSTITLCPAFPDGSSLGPRLTPHKATTATPQPNGVSPQQIPAVGDTLLAWHPWKILKAGTAKWHISTGNATPPTNRMELIGGDLSGGTVFIFRCGATQPPTILSHLNLHDMDGSGVGPIVHWAEPNNPPHGCVAPLGSFNVVHDNSISVGASQFMTIRGLSGGNEGKGGAFVANTFYRTNNNNVQVNAAGVTEQIDGFEVSYNTCFDIGTSGSGSGECSCLELDLSKNVTAQFNRMWNLSQGCGGFANAAQAEGASQFNLYLGNFVDGAEGGIRSSNLPTQGIQKDNAAINNYVAHTYRESISVPRVFSNLIRRWSDGNSGDSGASSYAGMIARQADGNVLDGAGSTRAAIGIYSAETSTPVPARYSNNAFFGVASGAAGTVGIYLDMGAELSAVTIAHNFMECGSVDSCSGLAYITGDPASSVAWTLKDNAVTGVAGATASGTAGGTNVTDTILNLTRFGGIGAAGGTWTSTIGEVVRDPKITAAGSDWNYQTTSLEIGAGLSPVLSTIGIRGRFFDTSLFPPFLLGLMGSLPVNTANEALTDIDRDGIPAFALGDLDSPDTCPWICDIANGLDVTDCKNAAFGSGQALVKGAN